MPFITSQTSKKPQRSPSLDRPKDHPPDISVVKKERSDNCEDNWLPSRRYWDSLPKYYLTKHALLEVTRRYYREHPKVVFQRFEKPVRRSTRLQQSNKTLSRDKTTRLTRPTPSLKRFARGGGPDLTSVCGYPYPIMADQSLPLNEFTPEDTRSRKTKPYDRNYELAINRAGIFTTQQRDGKNLLIEPDNYQALLDRLEQPLGPTSLDNLTRDKFAAFKEMAAKEALENNGMPKTVAFLAGDNSHFSWEKCKFDYMTPINPTLAPPIPHAYDGVNPTDIDDKIYKKLEKYICPSKTGVRPALPNFFELRHGASHPHFDPIEASHAVSMGARGMWMMQNTDTEQPKVYDNNAYSFLSITNGQTLLLYALHLRAPQHPGDRPEYHMTELQMCFLTANMESLKRCAMLYRNLRDLAREQRDLAVQQANQRVKANNAKAWDIILSPFQFFQSPRTAAPSDQPDSLAADNGGLQNVLDTAGPSGQPGPFTANYQSPQFMSGAEHDDSTFWDVTGYPQQSYAEISDTADPVVRYVPRQSTSEGL